MVSEDKDRITIVAPGRICLFGDHQDYLGLPVIACAIDRKITLTAEVNAEDNFNISLPDIQSQRTISISETFETLQARDYFASALRVVRRYGCFPSKGYTITIKGDIPINSGVSSSSALVVAWVHFLLKAFGCKQPITSKFIGQLAYEAEVLEHNEPGGKMDQYTSSMGNIVHIETGIPFMARTIGNSLEGLILADSGVAKKTIGVLSNAKENALKAIEYIQQHIPNFELEKVTVEQIDVFSEYIPEKLQPYFYAAVKNHAITQEALLEFEKDTIDLEKVGQLMTQHHTILKEILKVTVPEIDAMVDAALETGAYGAKIVGSGGGGSIVVVAPEGKEEIIRNAILNANAKAAYRATVAKGTHSK